MKNISGLVSGWILTILGLVLIVLSFTKVEEIIGNIVLIVYGLIALCVGIYLLTHLRQEDKIEQIGERNKKTKKVSRR